MASENKSLIHFIVICLLALGIVFVSLMTNDNMATKRKLAEQALGAIKSDKGKGGLSKKLNF